MCCFKPRYVYVCLSVCVKVWWQAVCCGRRRTSWRRALTSVCDSCTTVPTCRRLTAAAVLLVTAHDSRGILDFPLNAGLHLTDSHIADTIATWIAWLIESISHFVKSWKLIYFFNLTQTSFYNCVAIVVLEYYTRTFIDAIMKLSTHTLNLWYYTASFNHCCNRLAFCQAWSVNEYVMLC